MDDATLRFNRLRPRLQGIAYRMLGSLAEAEDLVQDVWLRWDAADPATLDNAEAWLVAVTTRLSIDRLRAAKLRRSDYVGFWLPEPCLTDGDDGFGLSGTSPATPEQVLERADDISVAFLVMLERLAPEARAAFLLREVFDADYAEVARALGKSEAACRQIVHRAKTRIRDGQSRRQVSPQEHHRLLAGFADAARRGDLAALQALLAEDSELISDGGGLVPSFGKALAGSARIARLFFASWRRSQLGQETLRLELVQINGQLGLLHFIDGQLESAHTMQTDGQRITRIHTQRNPDKLRRLNAAWGHVTHPGGQPSFK